MVLDQRTLSRRQALAGMSAAGAAAVAPLAQFSAMKLVTQPGALQDGYRGVHAADRVFLAAFTEVTAGQTVALEEAGREGLFVFDTSDLSNQVAADTLQGIYVAPSSDPSGGSGAWVRKYRGAVNARWFGATGVGDETLYRPNYVTDFTADPRTITQQTMDGNAINGAIRYLWSSGGGRLYIPRGDYRTYAYLERIDFPVEITGDGRSTALPMYLGHAKNDGAYRDWHLPALPQRTRRLSWAPSPVRSTAGARWGALKSDAGMIVFFRLVPRPSWQLTLGRKKAAGIYNRPLATA